MTSKEFHKNEITLRKYLKQCLAHGKQSVKDCCNDHLCFSLLPAAEKRLFLSFYPRAILNLYSWHIISHLLQQAFGEHCCMPGIDADAESTKMNKTKILSTFVSLSTLSPSPSLQPLCTPILHSSFWSYSSTYLLTSRSPMKALPKQHLILWIAPFFLKSFFLLTSDTTHPLGFPLSPLLFQVHATFLDH